MLKQKFKQICIICNEICIYGKIVNKKKFQMYERNGNDKKTMCKSSTFCK